MVTYYTEVKDEKVIEELKKIAIKNDHVLKAEDVLDAARSNDSVLHKYFEWDDSKAAEEYRLRQARDLIRVTVTLIGSPDGEPIKVFVSLTPDRQEEGGGFRELSRVMEDTQMRAILLNDAFNDMEQFQKRYYRLKELSKVFSEMKKVVKKYKPKKK